MSAGLPTTCPPDWRKERRMKKRLISILLAVVMVMSLLPMAALAADDDTAAKINPDTGRETGPAGNRSVAMMLYGESISDAVMKSNYDIDDFWAALKSELQGVLANEKIPEAEVYLVNDQNQEYRLEPTDDGRGASFIHSFQLRTGGILAWLDDVYGWIMDFINWVIGDIPTVGEFYRIYRVDNVPEGDYTLEIRKISEDGYTLWQPRNGSTRVHVGSSGMNYIGYEQSLGSHTFTVDVDLWIIDFEVEVWSIDFSMPGVFMRTEKPGISFTSADMGGHPLPGTEFMMINRDETANIIKAAFALGKETFENAMKLVGTEGFTWKDLSILYNEVLQWDSEAQQISLNDDNAYKLLQTYWALVSASGKDPLLKFMNKDTNIRVPAILKATADEKGVVSFTEDSNVTLIWSLEILLKMGNLVLNSGITDEIINSIHFEDQQTESLVKVIYWILQYAMDQGVKYWDENTQTMSDFVNDWIYPVLQNDHLKDYAIATLKLFKGEEFVKEHNDVLQWLPDHAFLTAKMPSGSYILMETGAPNGYLPSPLFYTMNLEWRTENKLPSEWCYGTIGNLGVIGPYFAENYYTFLRNNSAAAMADNVLNKINGGKTETLIQDTLSGAQDVTAMSIAYWSHIIYNDLGGSKVYDSEVALAEDMTKYLYTYGRTSQNLLMFADKVAKKSKSVISSEVTPAWTYYTASTSIRTNIALQVQSIMRGIADSVDTSGSSKVSQAVKDTINEMANNIDTSNRIIKETTAIQKQIKESVTNIAKKAVEKLMKPLTDAVKWFVKMATKP